MRALAAGDVQHFLRGINAIYGLISNPAQRDRLALWGRRLLGEAVTHAQRVVAERDELAEFIVLGSGEKGGVAGLIRTVQTAHGRRMGRLGLS